MNLNEFDLTKAPLTTLTYLVGPPPGDFRPVGGLSDSGGSSAVTGDAVSGTDLILYGRYVIVQPSSPCGSLDVAFSATTAQ